MGRKPPTTHSPQGRATVPLSHTATNTVDAAPPRRYAKGVSSTSRPRPFLRLRGRSFMAVVLTPEPPLAGWMLQLDGQLSRSPRFFDGRPVVVDLAALPGLHAEFAGLMDGLAARGIRVIGIEGVDEDALGPMLAALPPVIAGGRTVGLPVLVAEGTPEEAAACPAHRHQSRCRNPRPPWCWTAPCAPARASPTPPGMSP